MTVEHQIQYCLIGSTSTGELVPAENGFAEDQFEVYANALRYKRLFPQIVHVNISLAFPMEGPNR